MTITLFAYDTPNARKISVALEEMSLDYRIRTVDLAKGEQRALEFQRLSPNGKIPAITDEDGPGGSPISIFESGAILLYLAQKTGLFWPDDAVGRITVTEWLMFQVSAFGPIPGQLHHYLSLGDNAFHEYAITRLQDETARLYGVLDTRLAQAEFLAGSVSIADFAALGWAWRHARHRVSLDDFPHVKRWYFALMDRPAVQRGFAAKLS